jgi:hypothetical protein
MKKNTKKQSEIKKQTRRLKMLNSCLFSGGAVKIDKR